MYEWIVIVGGCFSFFAAMGIGANDVANAFATSIGSKALTEKKAVVIAIICETSGAILMGSRVSETIRKGIADYKCFEDNPDVFMYGCMWVCFSVGLWLFVASYFEMPVSTTHSCVGGMIGMTIALGGQQCVIWYESKPTFPYIGGVSGIVISWVLSPLFSGLIASFIFYIMRLTVLRYDFKTKRVNIAYPIIIGGTTTLNIFFIIYKGAKGLKLDKISLELALGIAFGSGTFVSILTILFVPLIKTRIIKNLEKKDDIELKTIEDRMKILSIKSEKELLRVKYLHNNAEKFDEKTEEGFKCLQIFTAICASFSHGANDVANAIGPFAAIYTIWKVGTVEKNSVMDDNAIWILTIGGIGISFGLALYGYKIIYALGEKLCKITPSRGVAIELSSALIILTGSRLKIPLSTTHCQVGGTIGVGILENYKTCEGINCKILGKTILGWVLTLVIVAGSTGLLVSQGIYAPSIRKCLIYNLTNDTNSSL